MGGAIFIRYIAGLRKDLDTLRERREKDTSANGFLHVERERYSKEEKRVTREREREREKIEGKGDSPAGQLFIGQSFGTNPMWGGGGGGRGGGRGERFFFSPRQEDALHKKIILKKVRKKSRTSNICLSKRDE